MIQLTGEEIVCENGSKRRLGAPALPHRWFALVKCFHPINRKQNLLQTKYIYIYHQLTPFLPMVLCARMFGESTFARILLV